MIEFPEGLVLSRQLNETVLNKKINKVLPPTKLHKFCWFNGDPADYDKQISGQKIIKVEPYGIYVNIFFQNGLILSINDGVNLRFYSSSDIPKDYQLLMEFVDSTFLVFTVAMYGGIVLHDDKYDNSYYLKSMLAESPLSPSFRGTYYELLENSSHLLSVKAFLTTEQRFPGIGNGVLQDILFVAGIHPKRKINTLDKNEQECLLNCITSVLKEMVDKGGRDTEKDLFGVNGSYITKMSKNSINDGCPKCHNSITKEAYLGGSVYYCSSCQKITKK